MILNTRAEYDPHTDSVQVAVVVQDENLQSASATVSSGIAEIKSFGEVLFTVEFDSRHKVLWVEEDNTIRDNGQFYVFLLHPPIQRNMSVDVTINFNDGTFAKTSTKVRIVEETDEDAWQNPNFGGLGGGFYESDITMS